MKKNVQINPENSENEENSQNSTVLNEQPQQRVPVPQTAVLDNKLPQEEKLSTNKNGDHSESTSSRPALPTRDSPIEKKAKGSTPQKNASAQPQRIKESSKKKGARLSDWEEMKFTTKYLEGHNDLISSVDMDGSVLISGRFV